MTLNGTIWRLPYSDVRFRLARSLDGAKYVTGHYLKPGTNVNGHPGRILRSRATGGPINYILEEPDV